MSDLVNCHCLGCNHRMCTSSNAWVPVSNSHFTYEDSKTFSEYQMETVQQVREGSPESQLEGCSVRPIRCKTCRTTIGQRCMDTPEERAQFRYVGYLYPGILYYRIYTSTPGKTSVMIIWVSRDILLITL